MCKSARVQECKSTRVQECKSAMLQCCKGAMVYIYEMKGRVSEESNKSFKSMPGIKHRIGVTNSRTQDYGLMGGYPCTGVANQQICSVALQANSDLKLIGLLFRVDFKCETMM